MTKKYIQKRWSLEDLFPGHESPEFEKSLESLEKAVSNFEDQRSKLTDVINDKTFQGIIKELEAIASISNRLASYAGLWFTEDTLNQDAIALQAKIKQDLVSLQNRGNPGSFTFRVGNKVRISFFTDPFIVPRITYFLSIRISNKDGIIHQVLENIFFPFFKIIYCKPEMITGDGSFHQVFIIKCPPAEVSLH